jgi:hypothetical protein
MELRTERYDSDCEMMRFRDSFCFTTHNPNISLSCHRDPAIPLCGVRYMGINNYHSSIGCLSGFL